MRPQEVRSEVATFLNLARHFDQLKKRSLDLKERFGVRDRGYFTPAEEEEAARLFISYVHVRNALLESVLERRQSGLTEASADAFVLCLGGAGLLVDAAVFVRDSFGDHPAIRSKLNEHNPVFGIPPGTYDRIQESLTDPANNWHLQQAWRHYEKSRAELLVKASGCASVIGKIDQLAGLFSGSLQAYLKERMTVFGNRVVKGVVTQTFGKLIYGVQKSFSSMISDLSTRPEHRPGLPADVDQELRRLLRPGDVLLTRKEHVLTNYFLPGYWPHGALNLGSVESLRELGLAQRENFRQRQEEICGLDPDDSTRAIEALKDGVHLRTLGSPLGSDSVIVIIISSTNSF